MNAMVCIMENCGDVLEGAGFVNLSAVLVGPGMRALRLNSTLS